MKTPLRLGGLLALLLGFCTPAFGSAVDYYMKIDGIEGESRDDRHKGEIEILSFSWGLSQQGSHAGGGGGGAGKVSMQDFSFTMKLNKATPMLMLACATGQHIKEATLTCRKSGGDGAAGAARAETFLEIKFTDLLISSLSTSGSASSEDPPTESVSFAYSTITFSYIPRAEDGTPQEPVVATIRAPAATAQ